MRADGRTHTMAFDIDVVLLRIAKVGIGIGRIHKRDGGAAVGVLHPNVDEGAPPHDIHQIMVGCILGDVGEEHRPPNLVSFLRVVAVLVRSCCSRSRSFSCSRSCALCMLAWSAQSGGDGLRHGCTNAAAVSVATRGLSVGPMRVVVGILGQPHGRLGRGNKQQPVRVVRGGFGRGEALLSSILAVAVLVLRLLGSFVLLLLLRLLLLLLLESGTDKDLEKRKQKRLTMPMHTIKKNPRSGSGNLKVLGRYSSCKECVPQGICLSLFFQVSNKKIEGREKKTKKRKERKKKKEGSRKIGFSITRHSRESILYSLNDCTSVLYSSCEMKTPCEDDGVVGEAVRVEEGES